MYMAKEGMEGMVETVQIPAQEQMVMEEMVVMEEMDQMFICFA